MTQCHLREVIRTYELTKNYGAAPALSDLDLTVNEGSIFGFLGPNGAGKTTTIRLLMGFVRPTSGRATLLGHDCWTEGVQARRSVGYLVQADSLYPELSGSDQLELAAKLSGSAPTQRNRLLDLLQLSSTDLNRKLQTYSKGTRQKLALIAATQHDPQLLILDEPTDGLDPLIQRAFEGYLRDRHVAGRTIFMSSHDLSEVERTCERVAIVRGGRLITEESIEELRSLHSRRAEIVFADFAPNGLDQVAGTQLLQLNGTRATLLLESDPNPLLAFLAQHDIVSFSLMPPSLDDIFADFYRELEVN